MMRNLLVLACRAFNKPCRCSPPIRRPLPYPEGYRQWTHVKSMVINQGHPLYDAFGGIHHLYANKKAEQGYRSGKFRRRLGDRLRPARSRRRGNAVQEGARKVLGVMHKDGRKYKDTGGWGFEGFKGDSKTERAVGKNAATACFQCHARRRPRTSSSLVQAQVSASVPRRRPSR